MISVHHPNVYTMYQYPFLSCKYFIPQSNNINLEIKTVRR